MIEAQTIRDAIDNALRDPALLEKTRRYYSEIAASILLQNHERDGVSLRISDAGSCSLELWHDIRGELDIPEDPQGIARMTNGSLMGAFFACALRAGFYRRYAVVAEGLVGHDGIPGHVDATILAWTEAGIAPVLATVEFKWTAWTGDWRGDCKPAYRLQSGKYALSESAPQHFVVVYYAASPATIYVKDEGARIPGNYLVVHEFKTDETAFDVAIEYDRLKKALAPKPPEPDPPEAWNCKYCRFSGCPKNVNSLKGAAYASAQV